MNLYRGHRKKLIFYLTREVKDKTLTLASYERNEEYGVLLDELIEKQPL
jgi:hypothetical protein